MNKCRMVLNGLSGLLAVFISNAAVGQTSSPRQPPLVDRSIVVPPTTPPDRPNLPGPPERPAAPGKPTPSKEMKDLVREFQSARDTFRKQQLELNRQLKTASEEQRAIIRQQIQENLEQWREEQKARVEDLRQQAQQMKDDLKGLRDVIDSGTHPGDGRPRR